jgi:hypothetical protein
MEKVVKEETLYHKNGVLITPTRIRLPNRVYAVANITSAFQKETKPDKSMEFRLMIIGGAAFLAGIFLIHLLLILSCLMITAAIIMLKFKRSMYSIIVTTAASEREIYRSFDKEDAADVLEAINDAIAYRG